MAAVASSIVNSIVKSDEGVGHQFTSTYCYKYVLSGWWRRLFIGDSGLAGFLGGGSVVGVSYVNSNIRLSYPELVARLDSFGYSYRLPKRWRKKVPKDWCRRSGIIVVDVVSGVDCLVKLSCGYVERIQLVGSVRDVSELDRVAGFLRDVFGLEVVSSDLVCSPSAPRPDANRLKSISWSVARRARESWIPVTGFGRWLSDRIVEKLSERGGVQRNVRDVARRLSELGYRYKVVKSDGFWDKDFSEVVIVEIKDGVWCDIGVKDGLVKRVRVRVEGFMFEDEFADDVVKFFRNVFSANVPRGMIWRLLRKKGEEFVRGIWIEVVSAPRVGKSSGVLLGLMKWVVERGIDNYVVLVVVVNRRIGRQLYKYLLGAWKRVLKDLRELGWNAGMLAEKVRIRYYEGMESACLVNRRIHKFEDCLKCPLFQLYSKEWRRVYRFPVPVMDPVILRMSGYCPFQVLFSPVFWRNSFVVVHYRILPLVISVLERLGIKKVVVYFDEYLVHLSYRLILRKIDPSKFYRSILDLAIEYNGRKVRFSSVLHKYNSFIEDLIVKIFMYYDEIIYGEDEGESKDKDKVEKKSRNKRVTGDIFGFLGYISKILMGEVNLSPIGEEISNRYKELVEILDLFYEKYRLSVFKRFKRYVMYTFNSFYRVEFDGKKYSRKFTPEVVGSGISSSFGGYVFSFMSFLDSLNKEIYVISSSVDDSNFVFESDISSFLGLKIVAPFKNLKYHRLSIIYNRGVVSYPANPFRKDPTRVWNYIRSLNELFELLKNGKRNVAVVVDKESMLKLAKGFEQIGWRIEYGRDSENPDIIDYIVIYRPDNSIILLFHPHGRTAMGVDPPYKDRIESVVIALGVRSYPRFIVPVPRVFRSVSKVLEGRSVSIDDLPGMYCVVCNGFLYVYDVFSLKFDLHLMIQVIGRFFLSKSMRFVLLNPRYGIRDIKFFVLISYVDVDNYGNFAGRVFKVNYIDKEGNEYSEYQLRLKGLRWGDVIPVLREINIERFTKSDHSSYVLDLRKVRFSMYNRLRNVYNSLRYCRVQLRYGHQPEKWWLIKKFVFLINGFEYAKWEKLSVPIGLKRVFEKYVNCGLEEMLRYIYNRYLQGIDKEIWEFIRTYVYKFTRSWWWWLNE